MNYKFINGMKRHLVRLRNKIITGNSSYSIENALAELHARIEVEALSQQNALKIISNSVHDQAQKTEKILSIHLGNIKNERANKKREVLQISRDIRIIRELTDLYQEIRADKKNNHEELSLDAQNKWRAKLRKCISINSDCEEIFKHANLNECNKEFSTLLTYASHIEQVMNLLRDKRIFFSGHCYYNNWYLSRGLRKIGWQSLMYNFNNDPASQIYYHGQDIQINSDDEDIVLQQYNIYLSSIYNYDVVHFSNAHGISYGYELSSYIGNEYSHNEEIFLLKSLSKKLTYTNNGCLDGVSQLSFSKWGDDPVCNSCRWQNEPSVCNDKRNLDWGYFKERILDYQCLLGGNRADFNSLPTVHERPEAYCLDGTVWSPSIKIPIEHNIRSNDVQPGSNEKFINLYHVVGNSELRTRTDGKTIKSTNIYLPLIEKLKSKGYNVRLINPKDVPNLIIRYYQLQSDIVLDMLEYGWFGANAREAMMLGIPVICYIRPEWLESLREEIPEYADELPIISATPATIETVLIDLINNPEKRKSIGKRSREFMLKWHDSEPAAKKMDEIYSRLLDDDRLTIPISNKWKLRAMT